MKYHFTLKRSNYVREDGTKRLYLYVNDGNIKYYPLNIYLRIHQLKGSEVVKHPNAEGLNKTLNKIVNSIDKAVLDGDHVDVGNILNDKKPGNSFNEFYKSQLGDPSFAESSLRDQQQTYKILCEFNPDIRVLDYEFVQKFNTFLVNKYGEWTVYKHHKNVKKFINLGIKTGGIKENPYILYKVKRPRSDKVKYLNWDELGRVEDVDVSGVHEFQIVKDMFLFSCYTALRWSDVSGLTWEQVNENKITLERMYKVDRRVFLRLDELFDGKAISILKTHENTTEKVFPNTSNHVANAVLKDISRLAKIKPMTFHMGRHTFGTLMASKGESIYRIMQLMGISKFETAQVYINLGEELI